MSKRDNNAARRNRIDTALFEVLENRQLFSASFAGANDLGYDPTVPIRHDVAIAPSAAIVSWGSKPIANGECYPSLADGTAFPDKSMGGVTPCLDFSIKNYGNATLKVLSADVSGDFHFTSSINPEQLAGKTVQPGGSMGFGVRLRQDAGDVVGVKSGWVTITTNDPKQPTICFQVGGTVLETAKIAKMVVTGANNKPVTDDSTSITTDNGTSFGTVDENGNTFLQFTVRNDGNTDLVLSNPQLTGGFCWTYGYPSVIAAGTSQTFSVSHPRGLGDDAPGNKRGTISFKTNDPNHKDFVWAIGGTIKGAVQARPAAVVTGKGNKEVKDDNTSISVENGTSFGTVKQGNDVPRLDFILKNNGNADLVINKAAVEGDFCNDGGSGWGAQTLKPGETLHLGVVLPREAWVVGNRSGRIAISTNDPNHKDYVFAIGGTIAPKQPALPSFAKLTNGVLTVTGTNKSDKINLSQTSSQLSVSMGNATQTFSLFGLKRIVVNAGAGNDTISTSQSVTVAQELNGGDGNDLLIAGRGNDVLRGGSGNDTLMGHGGDDALDGGTGSNRLDGGSGNDRLFSKNGIADFVKGGPGSDTWSGDANDQLQEIEF